ncbi:MAG: beta-galactosidase trimerization domain-containing protein, partial [Abditibacteriales bacterium]|nr:beta-galactosidase trimerization domain-containing protein [Abditibacteriales bacterium]MDW8366533.1 beta-galactosidase trimerization domain-containing protein [Abditibacteriales bacterium]
MERRRKKQRKDMTCQITRREWMKAAAAAVTASITMKKSAISQPSSKPILPTHEASPWYRRALVGIEIGPTGANDKDHIFLSKATGEAFIEHCRQARAEYVVVFMKDQNFAYYNSRVARKCPNLGARDLLRECLEAAQKINLPVIAYVQVQYDTSSWNAHPEWRMKDSRGKDIGGRLCFNSGYIEFIKQVLDELMQYAISGFHVDMLDYGFSPPVGCWCEKCQALFRATYGVAMPSGVTWDDAWEKMLEFRYNSNTRFCQTVQAFVRERRPDVSVDFNYHGYPPFAWLSGQRPVQHALNGDFVTAEGLPWIFGHTNPSLLSLFMAGARPGGPMQGVSSRGVFDYHDFTVRPVAEMKWEVLTYLAHGAQFTMVDKLNYDGSLDRVAYERLGEVFGEAIAKRAYFGHPSLPEVGLYYSVRSRDWFGREDSPRYMAAFCGAHKALVQAHIPMGFLMDENVSLERLRAFPVVYVPNAAVLTEEEVALFEQYVAEGGNLLITGLTGCCDLRGELQSRCALENLVGARLKQVFAEHRDNYLRFSSNPQSATGWQRRIALALSKGIPSDWDMLTYAPVAAFAPTTAQALGELLVAHRSQDNPWSRHMSADKVIGPAVLFNAHGKGKVLFTPCSPDAAFIGEYRMPEHRHFIRNLVRILNPTPAVLVTAPTNVEIVVTSDAGRKRLLIHFLCFCGPATATAAAFPHGKRVLPTLMEEPMRYE